MRILQQAPVNALRNRPAFGQSNLRAILDAVRSVRRWRAPAVGKQHDGDGLPIGTPIDPGLQRRQQGCPGKLRRFARRDVGHEDMRRITEIRDKGEVRARW